MIYTVLVGVLLALDSAPIEWAAVIIVSFIIGRAVMDIAFPKKFITGTESPYVLYVQNLRALHDLPNWPWIGYLIQSSLYSLPTAFVVYFVVKYFRD